jgi:SnoaL-like domain
MRPRPAREEPVVNAFGISSALLSGAIVAGCASSHEENGCYVTSEGALVYPSRDLRPREQPPLGNEDKTADDQLTLIARPLAQQVDRPSRDLRAPSALEAPWTKADIVTVAINNALDRFHVAASKSDFDGYFSAWTDQSVFLGTDATERWSGQEFKDFAKPYFDKGKGWTYHPRNRHVTILGDHVTAFFDELLDSEKLGLCRGSGVLVKQGEDWKILQYNLSIPVPNDLAAAVTEMIRKPPAPAPDPAERKK